MKTVSFYGTCLAGAEKVLVSPRIGHGYVVERIRARFAIGCEHLLKLRFFMAMDDETPTSGKPSGVSMLADYGQVDYIIGDGDAKDMLHSVEMPEGGSFLKVHAINSDAFDHDIDVQMEIQPIIVEAE